MSWLERKRTLIIVLIVVLITAGGAVLIYRLTALPGSNEILISPPSPEIAVYVEGEVASPGVYILQEGSLVEDAVEAAGGLTSDASQLALNLAAPVRDGDRIHIYGLDDVPQKVNLNTAEAWLLEALPGIGEVLSQRIIDYREENGPFMRIDDLKMVEGIGPAAFDKLKDLITVY